MQDRKFIAPETREPVAATKDRADALCRGFDQPITGLVTEGIVDLLEAIEIEIEQGEGRARTGSSPDLGINILVEQRPIGKTGEKVLPRELLRARFAFYQYPGNAARMIDDQGSEQRGEENQDRGKPERALVTRLRGCPRNRSDAVSFDVIQNHLGACGVIGRIVNEVDRTQPGATYQPRDENVFYRSQAYQHCGSSVHARPERDQRHRIETIAGADEKAFALPDEIGMRRSQ